MRNEYRITRASDGRLIVKPSDGPVRFKWRLGGVLLTGSLLFGAGNLAFDSWIPTAAIELPWSTSKSAPPLRSERKLVRLTLPVQSRSSAEEYSVENAKTTTETSPIENLVARTEKASLDASIAEAVPEYSLIAAEIPSELPNRPDRSSPTQSAVHEVTIESGDSLYTIFDTLEISQREFVEITKGEGRQLKRIHPGQTLAFHMDEDGSLTRLVYQKDEVRSTHFVRAESGFKIETVETAFESRQAFARGQIDSSLFLAGQAAGLPDKTIIEMAEIFGWDVDFALDIRAGDRFSIIYEELFKMASKSVTVPF